LVRALLKYSHGSASDIAQFNPTDTCYASRTDCIVRHYRFVVTKITIGEPEHEAVADSVQRGAVRLGHAGAGGGAEYGETRRGRVGEKRKCGVTRSAKIHMEVIDLISAAAGPFHERIGSARWRQRPAIKVGRQV